MKIAFGCHLLAILLVSAFGFVYLFRSEFMPYHAAALAREWSAVEYPVQVLFLALMRTLGGAWLGAALALLYLLVFPFRQGARWARWIIPAVELLVSASALYATVYVTQNTPATAPWLASLIGLLLGIAGLVFSESSLKPIKHS